MQISHPGGACGLILVAGMHRSGTSLLAHHLCCLGLNSPGPLVGASLSNPDGHFEPTFICQQNEKLLIHLGRWWPSASAVDPLPREWLESSFAEAAAGSISGWLREEASKIQGPLMIKDPRLCLLLPLWRSIASQLNWPIQLIINIRSPRATAASLVRRDALIVGMSLQRAFQLWWQHYRSLLIDSEGLPVLLTAYENWHTSREIQIDALSKFLLTDISVRPELPSLRPNHSLSELETTPACALHLFKQLEQLCIHQDPDLTALRSWISLQPATAPRTAYLSNPPVWNHWTYKPILPVARQPAADLSDLHPWGAAALALSGGVCQAAEQLLHRWIVEGLDSTILQALSHLAPPAPQVDATRPPHSAQLLVIGADASSWAVCFWLAAVNHANVFRFVNSLSGFDDSSPRYVLLLQPLSLCAQPNHLLLSLSNVDAVWVPCPDQAAILRALRVPSFLLSPSDISSFCLSSDFSELGLPHPSTIAELGSLLVLGPLDLSVSPDSVHRQPLHIPEFQFLLTHFDESRLYALYYWLYDCLRSDVRLIRTQPDKYELYSRVWSSFAVGAPIGFHRLPITSSELVYEAAISGTPSQSIVSTVTSTHVLESDCYLELIRDEREPGPQPLVTVCISLYNYEQYVENALVSLLGQTLPRFHLVVVDDCSTDQSFSRVQAWLLQHCDRFERVLLVRHPQNLGLSAARNTAFNLSCTSWCFVLDADNTLEPSALSACEVMAKQALQSIAVIHPLIRVCSFNQSSDVAQRLMSGLPWLRSKLALGNYIDAMALVRRSAWETVAGYDDIPGGWEDFDFWCKLVDAGFQGQLCPLALATYYEHPHSMLMRFTRHQIRRISRLLQSRHPWLDLPYAQPDA